MEILKQIHTVLFESALQHLADRPESLLAQPKEVQEFFGKLPAAWDETKFVAGYPGEYAVVARKKGNTWYIGGINGKNENLWANIDLSFIQNAKTIQAFYDADNESKWSIENPESLPKTIEMTPRGGFVLVVE